MTGSGRVPRSRFEYRGFARCNRCRFPIYDSGVCLRRVDPMRALFLLIPMASGVMPITAATAARPPIGHVANLIVKTDNLDEARRFYVGVLGYAEVFRHKRAVSGPAELSVFKVKDRKSTRLNS